MKLTNTRASARRIVGNLFRRRYIPILLVLLFASCMRLWGLDRVPSGITNDEAGAFYSAYSIWKTGRDPTGAFLPISINLDNSFSPVFIYLAAPIVGTLGVSPATGRLLFALTGIGSVLLVYLLALQLFTDRKIALFSASVLTVSPWHSHISRSGSDATVALFFFLLATYVFLRCLKRGTFVWSLPLYLLAFYSYHATKVFYVFFIPLVVFIYRHELFRHRKQFFLFGVGTFLIVLSFLAISRSQNISRYQVLLTADFQKAADMVNWERQKNTAPQLLRTLLSNKPLYYLRVIRENYLEAFSLNYLFLYGDRSGIYHVYFRGMMYIIELPLLMLGVWYLLKSRERKTKVFLFGSLALAPLPSAFTVDHTYVMRAVMMLPVLSLLVGLGVYFLLETVRKYHTIVLIPFIILFISLYGFLCAEYYYQYFFRYVIYGAESYFRSNRDLIEYLNFAQHTFGNITIAGAGEMFLFQYGVWNATDPVVISAAWQQPYPKHIENITLIDDCRTFPQGIDDPKQGVQENEAYIVRDRCHHDDTPTSTIPDLAEPLRVIWKIYERPLIRNSLL